MKSIDTIALEMAVNKLNKEMFCPSVEKERNCKHIVENNCKAKICEKCLVTHFRKQAKRKRK